MNRHNKKTSNKNRFSAVRPRQTCFVLHRDQRADTLVEKVYPLFDNDTLEEGFYGIEGALVVQFGTAFLFLTQPKGLDQSVGSGDWYT